MKNLALRATILEKIRNYYCATGRPISISKLAEKTGIRSQQLTRIIKELAKSGDLIHIGSGKPRQTAYVLPANTLIPPSLLLESRPPTRTQRLALPDTSVLGATALYLHRFFRRQLSLRDIEHYLQEMRENPSPNWENEGF